MRHIALFVLLVLVVGACYAVGFRKGFILLVLLGGMLEFVFWGRLLRGVPR